MGIKAKDLWMQAQTTGWKQARDVVRQGGETCLKLYQERSDQRLIPLPRRLWDSPDRHYAVLECEGYRTAHDEDQWVEHWAQIPSAHKSKIGQREMNGT